MFDAAPGQIVSDVSMDHPNEIQTNEQQAKIMVEFSPIASAHPVAIYLASLGGPEARCTMKWALDTVAELLTAGGRTSENLNWPAVDYKQAIAIRDALSKEYSYATINRMLSALKSVIRECLRLGLVTTEHCEHVLDVRGLSGSPSTPVGRNVPDAEMVTLYSTIDADRPRNPALAARDAALVAMLYQVGLRRSEVSKLQYEDVEFKSTDSALIAIQHHNKNRSRTVRLSGTAVRSLQDWLSIRGKQPGILFHPVHRSGSVLRKRGLNVQSIYLMLSQRAQQAGIATFSPNDMRRSTASSMLEREPDSCAQHAGIANRKLKTTSKYYTAPQQELTNVANRAILLRTHVDIMSLDIIDFNRLNGYWENSGEALNSIWSWLTANGGAGFMASWMKPPNWGLYERNDFPGWEHSGNHVAIARTFWNWFVSTRSSEHNFIQFSDSPDFFGQIETNRFWGDIGRVSASAFLQSIKQMREGDVWISLVGNGNTHIVLEALYSPQDYSNTVPYITPSIEQLSLFGA